MGLIKKSQVLNSNTLDLINNLVEIKDNSIDSSKLSFNYFEKIADITCDANTSQITINDLDGNNEEPYILFVKLKNVSTDTYVFRLFFNNDANANNYHYTALFVESGSVTTAAGTGSYFTQVDSNQSSISKCFIMRDVDNHIRFVSLSSAYNSVSTKLQIFNARYDTAVSNITSIIIKSIPAEGIGAGSRILLYRCRQ